MILAIGKPMKKRQQILLCVTALLVISAPPALAQNARDYIYIVGSSTAFPFSTIVAERFGRASQYRTPKVEATGSGGGLKLFCDGIGADYPDIVTTSRAIKRSEMERCEQNGVLDIVEVRFGYDGIVIAHAVSATDVRMSRRDIFLALAKQVPAGADGDLIPNPHVVWSDVNPELPDIGIEVLGPPPTSGTRDILVELAMEDGCQHFAWIAALRDSDPNGYRAICHAIREDGAYVEAGENDNLIVHKLATNPDAFGIFGFSFLDQNSEKVKGVAIGGVRPSFEAISTGDYPVARPMFFYAKKAHVGVIPGLQEFLWEFSSERAWGENGYLADRGLIPMPDDERREMAASIRDLTPLASANDRALFHQR